MSQKDFYLSFRSEKKPVYIFAGDDSFLKKRIVNFAKKELKEAYIFRKFRIEDNGFSEAVNLFKNPTLFGDKYLIYTTFSEIDAADKKKILNILDKMEKYNGRNLLFIFFDKLKSNDKIVKAALSKNCFFQLSPPTVSQLKQFIIKFFKQKGIAIESSVPDFLMDSLNNNLEAISLELQKITASVKKGDRITVDFLKKIVLSTKEENIFNLVNTFLDKDIRNCLKIYQYLLELNTDVESIINTFLSSLNTMLIIKDGINSDTSSKEVISKFKIHPYAYKINAEKCRQYSTEHLYLIFRSLLKIQVDIRGRGVDGQILFRQFLLQGNKSR